MPTNRTTTITGVFAKNASTTIPLTPVAGNSYRDTGLTQAEAEEGFPYKEIVDSATFNQMLFEYSSLTKLLETYGFLPWSNLTDYQTGSICMGSNGTLYQAKQSTGPSTTAIDPTTDSSNTYWEDFVGKLYVTLATAQTITGAKTFGTNLTVKMNKPKIFCDDDDETWATDPATDGNAGGYEVRGSDGNWGALFRAAKYTNGNRSAGIQLRGKDMSSQGSFDIWVTSDGSSAASATNGVRASITEWGTPDYTSITAISSGYTAPKNGFYLFSFPQRGYGNFTIGSYTQSFDYNYSYTQPSWCCYPVKKGQAVTFSGCTVYFAQSNGG